MFKSDATFRELVCRASEHTGSDLEKICLRGPERELTRTQNLQPLLTCVCLGYLRQLEAKGLHADLVLGHSLGEIAALAAAGCVTLEMAVDLAAKRGAAMEAAATQAPGGLVAVLSFEQEKILSGLAQNNSTAQIVLANDNAPGQFVIAGDLAALDQAARWIVAEKLGQCRRLAVAGSWHSPRMEPARRAFALWLETIALQPPRVPMLFNVTGETEDRPEQIRQLVARNLVAPVRWRSALERLRERQPLSLYEIGPGRVLAGLARANGLEQATKIFHVSNLRGVEFAARLD